MMRAPNPIVRASAATAALVLPVAAANALVREWAVGAVKAPYLAPGSWAPAGVPSNEDATVFTSGGVTAEPFLTGQASHRLLIVRTGTVDLDLGGHDLLLTWDGNSGILVGDSPSLISALTLIDGGAVCNHVTVAAAGAAQSSLGLTGATSLTTLELDAGILGSGQVSVTGGADLGVLGTTTLGQTNMGVGNLAVSGVGSTLNAGPLICARLGIANASVSSGAFATCGAVTLAELTGSSGTVSVFDGAQFEASSMNVGIAGEGEVLVQDGSALEIGAALGLGVEPPGDGTLRIDGGSTCFVEGFMVVGWEGAGTLDVDSATLEVDGVSDVAFAAGSEGTVTLTNATWFNAGQIRLGLGGAATLSLTNSTVQPASLVTVYADSTLCGDGFVDGGLTNLDGVVCPGGSGAGALNVTGSYVQDGGRLEVGIGASSDQFTTGFAFLGGALVVSLLEGYVPAAGEQFVLIDATGINGFFETVALPEPPVGLTWALGPEGDDVVLTVLAECGADVNGDGIVDVQDLVEVIVAWGACPGNCAADLDRNGAVDVQDLVAVILAWGPCA